MTDENINTSEFWNLHYTQNPYQDIFTPKEWEEILKPVDKAIGTILPSFKKQSVIDLACGIAYVSDYIAKKGHSVCAVDFSEVAIEESKRRFPNNSVIYFNCDIQHFLQSAREQDVIIAFEILEHYHHAQAVELLRAIHKSLKEGGKLVFSMPYDLGRQAEAPYHHSKWNYGNLADELLLIFKEVTYIKTLAKGTTIQGVATK